MYYIQCKWPLGCKDLQLVVGRPQYTLSGGIKFELIFLIIFAEKCTFLSPSYLIFCAIPFLLVLVTNIIMLVFVFNFFLFSVLCILCCLYCFCIFCVLFLLFCCLFPIFVHVSRSLPPGGNPAAVNKYIIHNILICTVFSNTLQFPLS